MNVASAVSFVWDTKPDFPSCAPEGFVTKQLFTVIEVAYWDPCNWLVTY